LIRPARLHVVTIDWDHPPKGVPHMTLRLLAFLLALLTAGAAAAAETTRTAHDFAFTSIDGEPLPLERYRGKVLLVVNTASFCGFTHQYGDLQAVWKRYRARGLVVLGVPSNDFGNQEPGKEAAIKQFCKVNFDVDFPLTSKVRVKGAGAHPFYRWAAETLGPANAPRWNFHKYLIARDGRIVGTYRSPVAPTSEAMIKAIEAQLAKPVG
jgi:glutathione peroxidase